jgi:drug/metabolite transporter (DMT)-like permease
MWRVYLLLGVVTLIAGLTPIGARMATAELPPLTIAFFRFATAGVLLAVTGKLLGLRCSFPKERWPLLFGLAALCVPINQIGFLVGVQRANATHAGIAYALVPVLVYWISFMMRRASLSARLVTASTLAFAGAAAVVLSTGRLAVVDGAASYRILTGDLLLLSAAITWAMFGILSQPVVRQFGALPTLTMVFLIGAMLQLPLVLADYVWFDLSRLDLLAVTWHGLAGFAYITLITAYVNYLLWYLILARYDVTRTAIVTNASFLITVLVEAAFLGQVLSWWVAAGSVLLLAGIGLATYAKRPAVVEGTDVDRQPAGTS